MILRISHLRTRIGHRWAYRSGQVRRKSRCGEAQNCCFARWLKCARMKGGAVVVSGAVPHTPVMLDEVLGWLDLKPDGTYIDATLGAGGHSVAIAERLKSGKLISLDRDEQALQ